MKGEEIMTGFISLREMLKMKTFRLMTENQSVNQSMTSCLFMDDYLGVAMSLESVQGE